MASLESKKKKNTKLKTRIENRGIKGKKIIAKHK